MATIYEVAARAGVSPATVSRVLNGIAVSPAYADRVLAAAEELNYVPNRTAQRLRRRSSEVIALVIPDIENPFFTALARGVEDRALDAGLSVVLCNSDEQEDKESRYLQVALSEHMAGVILAPASDHPDLDAIVAMSTPVVAVDRSAHGYDLDTVVMDDVASGRTATERLYAEGHSVVACITGPATVETAQNRAEGWRQVFAQRSPGAEPDAYLVHSNYRVDGGQAAMASLRALPEPPDAVFVANNLMGVGAMQALATDDAVGIAVLGDLPFGMFPRPGASVLPLPARELGVTAADLLLQRLNGDIGPARRIVLDSAP
ncbi:MAG: substrate-binding domain-containing protein [Propionibacteriales bacterium]|nr:substrate-binding domain-containing protein [Propionibacteriales bacterium]